MSSLEKRSIILAITACLFFAMLTCMLRVMTFTMDQYLITAYKAVSNLIILSPFMFTKKHGIKNNKIGKINLLQGCLACCSTPLWVLAIQNAQIPQVMALTYTNPIFAAVFASIFLKEVFDRNKKRALLLGLVGSYIVVGVNIDHFNKYSLLSLVVAATWGVKSVIMKALSSRQSPFAMIFYLNLIVLFIYSPVLYNSQRVLTLQEISNFALITIISIAAQTCLTLAYKNAKMSVILPFDYLRLVFASILAFVLFGEIISVYTVVGSVFIASGAMIMSLKKEKSKIKG